MCIIIYGLFVQHFGISFTLAQVSSGAVTLAPNSTAMSSVYTVNFSRAWRTAGARWELWPEPGLPCKSNLGRYEVGWLRTLLKKQIRQTHWLRQNVRDVQIYFHQIGWALSFSWHLRLYPSCLKYNRKEEREDRWTRRHKTIEYATYINRQIFHK